MSLMLLWYVVGGLPRFLFASVFPNSTDDIRLVFLLRMMWPIYFSLFLFTSVSIFVSVFSWCRILSFVLHVFDAFNT